LQCLLLLLGYWKTVCARPPRFMASAAVAGLAIGLLFLAKVVFILLAPIAWAALMWRSRPWNFGKIARVTFAFGVPLALSGLADLAWNYARWGSLLDFGYQNETFDTPLLVGLYGLFFSSGKSVFLYAPMLVAALFAARCFARRHSLEAIFIVAFSAPFVCIYATFWAWHGDWAWGPRYMLPFMTLWMLPVATAIDVGRALQRVAIAALAALGLLVQVLGVAVNPGTYLNIQSTQVAPKVHDGQTVLSGQAQADAHFVPEFSPPAGHLWLLKAMLEQWRDPGQPIEGNRALHDYPWLRVGHEHWKPEHPEYGMSWDLWLVDPPKEMGPQAVRKLRLLLIILAVLGLALIAGGIGALRRATRDAHASGAGLRWK